MPLDITTRIQQLKLQVETAKTEKTRAEARIDELTRQKDQVLGELQALGVTAESLPTAIAELEAERDRLLTEAEQLLQGVA